MKKILLGIALASAAVFANASDALHNTTWQTIDDSTKKPKAIVKFTELSNGTLTATIQSVYKPGQDAACSDCQGKYHNKPLKGLTVVNGLKNVGGKNYDNGSILDPQTGKTYKLKGSISEDGRLLNLRGFVGVAALGRDQTWVRTK